MEGSSMAGSFIAADLPGKPAGEEDGAFPEAAPADGMKQPGDRLSRTDRAEQHLPDEPSGIVVLNRVGHGRNNLLSPSLAERDEIFFERDVRHGPVAGGNRRPA